MTVVQKIRKMSFNSFRVFDEVPLEEEMSSRSSMEEDEFESSSESDDLGIVRISSL